MISSSKYKIKNVLPLIEKSDFYDDDNQNDIAGFIPLPLSTLPSQLSCVFCGKVESVNFILYNNLQEDLLNSLFGFIQIIFILIQAFNNLNKNVIKEIYEKIFELSNKKNALVNHFFKEIVVHLISKEGFYNDILLTKQSLEFFSNPNLKEKIDQIDEFPSYKNESSLLFQFYSNLITMKESELSISNSNNKDEIALLFEQYYEISNELFNDDDIEKNIDISEKSNNNNRLLSLLYYYSILLRNDKNLPYPMFIFVHEYIRQHFGGFCLYIDQDEIDKYAEDCQVNEILYHFDMFTNDFDLECTYKLVNINENKEEDDNNDEFNIFVHQNKDDQKILLAESNKVVVSFPFDVLIINNKSENRFLQCLCICASFYHFLIIS